MDTSKLKLNINDVTKIVLQAVFITISVYAVYANLSASIQRISDKLDYQIASQDRNNLTINDNSTRVRDLENRVTVLEQIIKL